MGMERMVSPSLYTTLVSWLRKFFRIPDLALSSRHPKRVFIRRAVEREIRLSYFDRIQKALPEPMQAQDAFILPKQAPGPDFEYDDPSQ